MRELLRFHCPKLIETDGPAESGHHRAVAIVARGILDASLVMQDIAEHVAHRREKIQDVRVGHVRRSFLAFALPRLADPDLALADPDLANASAWRRAGCRRR